MTARPLTAKPLTAKPLTAKPLTAKPLTVSHGSRFCGQRFAVGASPPGGDYRWARKCRVSSSAAVAIRSG